MNYLAHGIRFLHDPWFLAGTASPDWLSVADRQVRLRPRQLIPFMQHEDPRIASFACGVMQHFEDDDTFHQNPVFYDVSSKLTQIFKEQIGTDDGYRPSFLGHIVTELLLDRWLMENYPDALADYYQQMHAVDAHEIQGMINMMVRVPTTRVAQFIELFREIRFLNDYRDYSRMLGRLNQVMRRVKLSPLAPPCERVLIRGYELVEESATELLPFAREILSSPRLGH